MSFPSGLSPEIITKYAMYPLLPSAAPAYDGTTQRLTQDGYAAVLGGYTQNWVVTALTATELAAREASRTQATKDELEQPDGFIAVLLRIAYAQENRIRLLEGKGAISPAQFKAFVAAQV